MRRTLSGLMLLGLLLVGCEETPIRGDECASNAGCSAGWLCANDHCVPPCLIDRDCAHVSADAVCSFNHCQIPTEVRLDQSVDMALDLSVDMALDQGEQADAEPDMQVDAEPDMQVDAEPDMQVDAEPDMQVDAQDDAEPNVQGDAS